MKQKLQKGVARHSLVSGFVPILILIFLVAVIGAGKMAREHIRAFADIPGATLVGIQSRTRSRTETLAREFNITGVYDSIPELYEKTQAQLVVVAVFEMAMNTVSRTCFEFPWTVLLEKPPGYNVCDAEEIRDGS